MENKEPDIYRRAKQSIIDEDEELALKIVREAAEMEDVDLMDLLLKGFTPGNEEVSKKFDLGIISIAELIYASEVMRNVTDLVFEIMLEKGRITQVDLPKKIRVLLATVAGDIHDIGKGIVAACFKNAGFEVIDLGCGVSIETIASAAKEFNADIIGTSVLLTTSMSEQKKLEKYLRDKGIRENVITMVGGAPCTHRWAKKIGADAYTEDALEAVKVAMELINKREKND